MQSAEWETASSLTASPVERREESPRRFGDYELLEQIGRGGMGVVYKARQLNLNRLVAVKMIASGELASPEFVQRFHLEAEAAAGLQHPNIVAIHEVGVHEGQHFYSMDYLEGQTLAERALNNPLPPELAADCLKTIAEAVHYAHQRGILHRDLKPSNVLIDCLDQPHLTDFGLAKRLTGDSDLTLTGQVLGSPNYMPPEQTLGKRQAVTIASDVYSLGAILYFLLTGRPPFEAESLSETLQQVLYREPVSPRLSNAAVPRDLETLCLKCLDKDPRRRYGTALELAQDLGRFLEGQAVQARPVGAAGKAWRWCRRNPKLAPLTGVSVVLLLALGIGSPIAAFRISHERKRAEHEALVSRQNLYAADVSLAQNAWEEGNLGHARQLLQAHFPKAGQADLRGFEWRYFWNLCQGDQLHAFRGHWRRVFCVAFSPDGRTLASGSGDQTVKLWDVTSKQLAAELLHTGAVYCVAFSPDGGTLATGCSDDLIRFWDAGTRKLRFTLKADAAPEGWPARLAFSPTGTLLAVGRGHPVSGDLGGSVLLWDYAARKEVNTFSNAGSRIAFSPDGKILASGSWSNTIKLWDIASGRTVRTLENAGEVLSLAFSPHGTSLAVGTWDGDLQLWDAATGQRIAEVKGVHGELNSLAFSPDGTIVATGNGDHSILLWDVATRKELATLRGHAGGISAVVFSLEGKTLATASADETVMLWNVAPRAEREPIAEVILPPVFSPDGKILATVCTDNSIRFRDVASGRTTLVFSNEPLAVAFLSSGQTLVTLSTNYSLRFWDLASQTIRSTVPLARKDEPIGWATLSPDGKILATGGVDSRITSQLTNGTVTLWNVTNGAVIAAFDHDAHVRCGTFSPDSRAFAMASYDRTASVWDVATRQRRARLTSHKGTVWWVAFSPDGKTLATSSYDDTVKLWDVSTWKALATLGGHRGAAFGLAFSADGKTLAVCAGEGNVKLWNMATYREVAVLRQWKAVGFVPFTPEGKAVEAVKAASYFVFSPDGTSAAAVYEHDKSGLVRLWSAPLPTADEFPRRVRDRASELPLARKSPATGPQSGGIGQDQP